VSKCRLGCLIRDRKKQLDEEKKKQKRQANMRHSRQRASEEMPRESEIAKNYESTKTPIDQTAKVR
jgi:hypothetical protein